MQAVWGHKQKVQVYLGSLEGTPQKGGIWARTYTRWKRSHRDLKIWDASKICDIQSATKIITQSRLF